MQKDLSSTQTSVGLMILLVILWLGREAKKGGIFPLWKSSVTLVQDNRNAGMPLLRSQQRASLPSALAHWQTTQPTWRPRAKAQLQ